MKFDYIADLLDSVNEQMDLFVSTMDSVKAKELGLDSRAGYDLWVNKDCIVTTLGSDNSLQYYGGFEYVDKEFRAQVGDWVIYMADDERVREHIEQYFEREEAEA